VSDLGFFARNVPNQSGSSRVSEIATADYVWAMCGIAWILAILRTGAVAQSLTCPGVVRHLRANGGIAEAFFWPERARTVDCENMRRMTAQKVDLGVGRNLGDDLSEFRDLRLIPDWPHIRKLVAKRLGRSEDEIQEMAEPAMAKSDSLLDPAELVLAIEEGLGIHIDGYPQS